ncbi:MAG: hypothetical protein J6B06_05930 [Lachnospiraceae bacterium]|nr:hypothetical protein [Lachnospiraceae bacterium]
MKALRDVIRTFMYMIIFFAVILLFACGLDTVAAFQKPVDLYAEETDVTELGRMTPVEAEVYAVLECFCTETTTTKKNGAVTKKSYDYYYAIPVFVGEETYYAGVKVSDSQDHIYDDICDATWNWLNGTSDRLGELTVQAEGCFHKMDDELYGYMVETFEDMQWFESDADLQKYLLPVYLKPVRFHDTRIMFLVALGALIVAVAVVIVTRSFDKKRDKKVQEQTHVVINGVSYPKSTFDHVNRCIANRERLFAVQELSEITGLSVEEAQQIISKWNEYYLV